MHAYRFSSIMPSSPTELTQLEEEFLEYQLASESEIATTIWESAGIDEGHHQMDKIWRYMSTMKDANGSPRFQKLHSLF